jgi:hypothetical protein
MSAPSNRAEIQGELGQFATLVFSFAPWVAFLLIARDSLLRVKVGLIVGFALSIGLGAAKTNKGVILWASVVFLILCDDCSCRHERRVDACVAWVLANGTLATAMWFTLLVKRPFTPEYAKEHIAPSLWSSPRFILTSDVISAVWALSLSLNTALAFGKMQGLLACEAAVEASPAQR